MKESSVLYQIKSLDKVIFRNLDKNGNFKEKIKSLKITPTQMQIIDYILEHKNKDVYQKDLEKILSLRRATISGVLQTMEKNNLIKRSINENDIRSKKIKLNDKTEGLFNQNCEKFNELEKIAIKDISKDELDIFTHVIFKMKNNIEKSNKN